MAPPAPLDRSPDSSSPRRLSRLLAPLAGIVALASLATGQADPAASAETGYLVLAAGIPLVAAAAVARGATIPVLATGATVALAWFVPFGPVRGALVSAVTVGATALAALVRSRVIGRGGRPDPDRGPSALLRPVPACGLALGLQALLRANELLTPPSIPWTLIVYVALPVIGALAILALARWTSPAAAGVAAAAALTVGPGFRPATVAALVALPAALILFGSARRGLGRADPVGRVGAALLLAAPFLWSPGAAAVSALAGGALALVHRPFAPLVFGIAGLAGGVVVATASELVSLNDPAGWIDAFGRTAIVVTLVPALVVSPLGRRSGGTGPRVGSSLGPALAVLGLALAAALAVRVDGPLAAPAALAGALAGGNRRTSPTARALQGGWSAALLLGAALAGSYPWLRANPLAGALGALGLPLGWVGAVTAVLGFLLLALLARALAVRERASALVAPVLILALLLNAPEPGTALVRRGSPLELTAVNGSWSGELRLEDRGGRRVGSIVLDTTLGNAGALPEGTPVATITLRTPDRTARAWTLHAGGQTGEWAADRPDLAADPTVASAPPPWLSWVSAERTFFGHAYRAVLPMDEALPDAGRLRVEVRRRPDLPPEVVLTLFRLELRP